MKGDLHLYAQSESSVTPILPDVIRVHSLIGVSPLGGIVVSGFVTDSLGGGSCGALEPARNSDKEFAMFLQCASGACWHVCTNTRDHNRPYELAVS